MAFANGVLRMCVYSVGALPRRFISGYAGRCGGHDGRRVDRRQELFATAGQSHCYMMTKSVCLSLLTYVMHLSASREYDFIDFSERWP